MVGKKYESFKKFPGVRAYVSETRRNPMGRPDRCFYIRYRNSSGKLIEEKVGWESEGVTAPYAYKVRQVKVGALARGEEVVPRQQARREQTTVKEFFEDHYLPWCGANLKTPRDREGHFKVWIEPHLGDRLLSKLSPFDVERLKEALQDAGRSPRTLEHCLATLRHAWNLAKAWGFVRGENPVSKVKIPRRDNRRQRFLTRKEARRLLRACKKRAQQLWEMALLSLYTGMRAGEIFNLTWGDIDLKEGLIHIRDPKSGENRVSYITEPVGRMLRSKGPGDPGELVFKSSKGRRIKAISNTFDKVVEELGLNKGVVDPRDKVVFHTLRHTFCSWLAMGGTPLHVIKELAGHKTMAMTERYSHLLPDVKRRAVEGLCREGEGNGDRTLVPLHTRRGI